MKIIKEALNGEMFLDIILSEKDLDEIEGRIMKMDKVKLYGYMLHLGVRMESEGDE